MVRLGLGSASSGSLVARNLCFVKEDPGPSCLGGSRKDTGEFLQVRGDGLAKCSDFFTGGHGTDSVGTGLD